MAYKNRRSRKSGGSMNLYNAKGSPAAENIDAKSEGFKRGGSKCRADGGAVEGEGGKHHMGRARGGAIRKGRARGGSSSPYSAARSATAPKGKNSSCGPGEQAPTV
jgi:hypothetical protein